jgi:hypothetical protein
VKQHDLPQSQSVKMPEPEILPSIEGMGAKLGEGMKAIDFQLTDS